MEVRKDYAKPPEIPSTQNQIRGEAHGSLSNDPVISIDEAKKTRSSQQSRHILQIQSWYPADIGLLFSKRNTPEASKALIPYVNSAA